MGPHAIAGSTEVRYILWKRLTATESASADGARIRWNRRIEIIRTRVRGEPIDTRQSCRTRTISLLRRDREHGHLCRRMSTALDPLGVLHPLPVPMGLGLLRLSTDARPPESDAIGVIHHALDHGIRLLDTADSYCLHDKEAHYGEHLARKALQQWAGPRDEVRVVTKVGFARPKGKWVPDGEPEHIRKRVEGSLRALGGDTIFLLLLHINDPKTPFEQTLEELAKLQHEGKVLHLGLSNTSIAEVRQAERYFSVRAIQNELSVIDRSSATEGLVELAKQLAIPFLAYRPLGGHAKVDNLLKNRAVKPIAARHSIRPHEAALASLIDLGAPVIPLFGATKTESIDSCLRARAVPFDDVDRAALTKSKISFAPTPEARFAVTPIIEPSTTQPVAVTEGPTDGPDVVIIMGVQGAGKSSEVDRYTERGYVRLNRDLLGGGLDSLVPKLCELLSSGQTRVILDNTYPTQVSRYPVIHAASSFGVPVRCRYIATSIDDAYINVVQRILGRYDRLLGPDDLKELAKTDPNLPPPGAMVRWAACFEPPTVAEGFSSVEVIPFVRRVDPTHVHKGLLLDVDGTLRKTRSGENYPKAPDDIEILPGRREALTRWVEQGYSLFFVSNQSGIASESVSQQAVDACFSRTVELLGLPVADIAYCPHPAFPVGCFCRKPLPGLGVSLMHKHKLAREHLVMVGDLRSDQGFAKAIGAKFESADTFFSKAP